MNSSTLTLKTQFNNSRKITVELDADKFERLAASLGLFSKSFLRSLEKAEEDYREGKTRIVPSLRVLRKIK